MTDGASSKGALVGVIIGTLAAAGGGFGFATMVLGHADCSTSTAAAPAKEQKPPERQIWPLQSIVTNLGSPAETYVRLEAGIVQVNQNLVVTSNLNYGGFKNSGLGKEASLEAMLEHFTQKKTIVLNMQ